MVVSITAIGAQAQTPLGPVREADKAAPKKADIDKFMMRTGGFIERETDGSHILFVSNADERSNACLVQAIKAISALTKFNCKMVKSDFKDSVYSLAEDKLKSDKCKVVIAVGQSKSLPKMLVAPDSNWGYFNLQFLEADKCSDDLLQKRITKQCWRTLTHVMGGANVLTGVCLMKPASTLEQLDALNLDVISPEPLMKIEQYADKVGLEKTARVLYRTAVIQGWAPAPTNAHQKAVWDKIKSGAEGK